MIMFRDLKSLEHPDKIFFEFFRKQDESYLNIWTDIFSGVADNVLEDTSTCTFICIFLNNILIGVIGSDILDDGNIYFYVYICCTQRRNGYASDAMKYLLGITKDRLKPFIRAATYREDLGSIEFYKKIGFTVDQEDSLEVLMKYE